MAGTIMDRMQDAGPEVYTNALYEMIMDWYTHAHEKHDDLTRSQRRNKSNRKRQLETDLSRFFGVTPDDMRGLLRTHFGLKP